MARTANPKRPEALLDAVVNYLITHGVSDVSLRPLAKSVGSSPRVLLYYFGSKEALIARAFARLRDRQRATFSSHQLSVTEHPRELCRAVWRQMSGPESEPLFHLFLQAVSIGLQDPEHHADFLRDTIEDWLAFLAEPRMARGEPRAAARLFASVVLAGFRGLMLDLCASRDRKRVDAAVDIWLQALDAIPQAVIADRGLVKKTRRRK